MVGIRRLGVALALNIAVCTASVGAVEAAPSKADRRKADKLERLAKSAYKKGQFDDAVAAFEAAYNAVGRIRYLYNLARCHERLGEIPQALEYVESYLDVSEGDDRTDGEALRDLLEVKLAKTTGVVRITSIPDGAAVVLLKGDERLAEVTPYEGKIAAGRWTVRVKRTGYLEAAEVLNVTVDEPAELEVVLQRDVKRSKTPMASWVPWAVLGTGVAITLAGVVMGSRSSAALDRREGRKEGETTFAEFMDADDEARSSALLANVFFGVGGAAAAAGAVLMFAGPF